MANNIAWEPSLDPTITPSGSYIIEASRQVSGPWYFLAQVSASLTGANYLSGVNRFVYNDETNPYSTWYHILDVDQYGHISRPSDPFLTHAMPYFVAGSTPFGVYDHDAQFVHDADQIVDFVRKKLGEPVMEVSLENKQIYAAFEEAMLEYSAMVNSYQAKSTLPTFLGSPTGTLTGGENKYVVKTLALAKNIADPYATEANENSRAPMYSGSMWTQVGQQSYDIPNWLRTHDIQGNLVDPLSGLSVAGLPAQWSGSGTIVIRELYHRSPLQAYRFFGTTSGLNYLNNQFRFESFTPETLFYLLPIWEDVLRGMQFKTSNTVRRSNYSFDLHNNHVRLFPVPQQQYLLWFTYNIEANPMNVADYSSTGSIEQGAINNPGFNGVSNLSNIPFGNIPYSGINSLSKHWVRRMALALAKEVEGQIRSKMNSIPIPNGDLNLNGAELIADARAEMESLRGELKEMLEETTYQKLMEKEAAMTQNLQETWKGVPLGIYIG